MVISRRAWLGSGLSMAAAGLGLPASAAPAGTLVFALPWEPQSLTNALSTEGTIYPVSGKLFDGLLGFDAEGRPQPKLAVRWATSADGLALTLQLREGVQWHDGQPFTSADVAYSVEEVWKKYNGRGRSTFANVTQVDTPDARTAVLRLSKPAPYLLSALTSIESQVVPRHLYAGGDPLLNPHNAAPVGTGPWRFVRRQRGSFIELERNPHYWDAAAAAQSSVQRLVFRIVPDAAAVAAALETGEAHIGGVPLSSLERLRAHPALRVDVVRGPMSAALIALEFNLDRPALRDVRVRQALSHAIDRDFIRKSIFYGYVDVAESAIPPAMAAFAATDVPRFAHDPDKARALLDAAGLKPDGSGVRLTLRNDPTPSAEFARIAQYLRSAFAKVGVRLEVRSQDFPEFVNRIYTRRDWDTAVIGGTAGPDPAIGTQRWYWSKNFQPGVAFSNGTHYANAEVDAALEAAQTELDAARRRAHYLRFQQLVAHDLPRIPLTSLPVVIVSNRRVRDFLDPAEGSYGNFARATLSPA